MIRRAKLVFCCLLQVSARRVLGKDIHSYKLRPKRNVVSQTHCLICMGRRCRGGDFEVDMDALHISIKVVMQGITVLGLYFALCVSFVSKKKRKSRV